MPKLKNGKVNLKGATALKQTTVIHRYIKDMGKSGKERASLAKAGKGIYSKAYMESGELKKTKTWNQLMEKYIPDELLVEKHEALLKKEDVVIKQNEKGEVEVIHTGEIDVPAVKAGLELAHRIKGKNTDTLLIEQKGIQAMSDAELAELIKKQKARFNKTD